MQIDPSSAAASAAVSPSVRHARRADAPELVQLINRAYQVEASFVEGVRTDEAEVARLVEAGTLLVLDRIGGRGGVAATIYVRTDGRRGCFGMLSVAPDLQGAGVGRRLVAVAEALCQAQGCTEMSLEVVNLRDDLTPWYRRLGYREVGTAPYVAHRVVKRPCHFIRMEKPLAA